MIDLRELQERNELRAIEGAILRLAASTARNAREWKLLAQTRALPADEIASRMTLAVAADRKTLRQSRETLAEPLLGPTLAALWQSSGGSNTGLEDSMSQFDPLLTQVEVTPKTTYQEIIDACDAILAQVVERPTIWRDRG